MKINETTLYKEAINSMKRNDSNNLTNLLPGFKLIHYDRTTDLAASLYEPVLCLILQGSKETILGKDCFAFGAGECLIVSHDLPVVSRITEASPDKPYIAAILDIELGILRSLYEQIGENTAKQAEAEKSMCLNPAEPSLIDALGRYISLVNQQEKNILAPLILKEIHFRLLIAPNGGMLRKLLWHDSNASRISKAIEKIRKDFKNALIIPDLAKSVGMSVSSFHQHFRSITATTPLQYQKDLRLLEARRLLMGKKDSVSIVAFEVGYESSTQFSREYSRKFGLPPSKS
jgi:AraC-like DNA-binding protein